MEDAGIPPITSAQYIIAQRRAALYNIKVKHSGRNDFFGKDAAVEKQLEVEKQKLSVFLRVKGGINRPEEFLAAHGGNQ